MKTFTLFTALFISHCGWSNPDSEVMLRGTVIASSLDILMSDAQPTRHQLDRVQVIITTGEEVVHDQLTNSTGFFAAMLQTGEKYTVHFKKEGFLTRTLEVDTSEIPMTKSPEIFRLYTDITLYEVTSAFNYVEAEDRPSGRARYVQRHSKLEWDANYARMAFDRFMEQVKSSRELARKDP